MQKKRVAKELLSTFKDESIIVLADWLKVSSLSLRGLLSMRWEIDILLSSISGPRQPQELDQVVVCSQARAVAALQVSEGKVQPLDRDHHPQHL